MSGLTVKFSIKESFFNREKITRLMDKKTAQILGKAGAKIRLISQRSMRSRKKGSSPPGTPPFAHGGKELRKLIFYAYDAGTKTVVVGPVLFGRKRDPPVTQLQEYGGTATKKVKGKKEPVTYPERPFMRPALAKVAPTVADNYRNALRK